MKNIFVKPLLLVSIVALTHPALNAITSKGMHTNRRIVTPKVRPTVVTQKSVYYQDLKQCENVVNAAFKEAKTALESISLKPTAQDINNLKLTNQTGMATTIFHACRNTKLCSQTQLHVNAMQRLVDKIAKKLADAKEENALNILKNKITDFSKLLFPENRDGITQAGNKDLRKAGSDVLSSFDKILATIEQAKIKVVKAKQPDVTDNTNLVITKPVVEKQLEVTNEKKDNSFLNRISNGFSSFSGFVTSLTKNTDSNNTVIEKKIEKKEDKTINSMINPTVNNQEKLDIKKVTTKPIVKNQPKKIDNQSRIHLPMINE